MMVRTIVGGGGGGAAAVGGGGMFEEVEDDLCGDFFEHIDDLLDFPAEEFDGDGGSEELVEAKEQFCLSDPPLFSTGSPPFSGSLSTDDDLAAGLAVPCEDIAQLEWLSSFVEDSFSAGNIGLEEDLDKKDHTQFRSSSPVSVLESSSTVAKPMPLVPVPGRARSKRPRPATFSPRLLPVPLTSPAASSSSETNQIVPVRYITCAEFPPELDGFADSEYPQKKLSKKKKPAWPVALPAGNRAFTPAGQQQTVRKCMHCEITKTPQWRAGPMGPKTLCNACGVRYKSGRLYPEYRPAASPTFISCLHSNSHKKVVEMRVKSGHKEPAPVPQFVRKSSSLSLAKTMEA